MTRHKLSTLKVSKAQTGKYYHKAFHLAFDLWCWITLHLLGYRQSVRWKPPPPRNGPNDPHIGWRTEFRSMEIQLTDFENAAFTTFITLLTRVILTFDLNLYIPLSRVDANMQRAHGRDAARKGKFFFRRHMAPLEEGDDGFGEQYTSMFSRAGKSNGLPTIQSETSFHRLDTSTSSGSGEANEEAVSSKRRMAPTAR